MSVKHIIYAIVGLAAAGVAIWLLMQPTKIPSPYEDAIDATKRFGVEADIRLDAALKALAAKPPVDPASETCKLAKKALQQERVAMKAMKGSPPRDEGALTSAEQASQILTERTAKLQAAAQVRRDACGQTEEDKEQEAQDAQ